MAVSSIPTHPVPWFNSIHRPGSPGWRFQPPSAFSYALHNRTQGYIDGFMTVRKERRQRGTAYWSAYRRQGQRLRKRYIGRSDALTQARLEEIAALLRPRDGPPQPHTFLSA